MADTSLAWQDFLARAADGAPDGLTWPDGATTGGIAPLSHFGVLRVTGADAADFLHNQLTNDVLGLAVGQHQLAGYCSAKGRLLATLLVVRTADAIMLALPRDTLEATLKRLRMYVLRAKVTFEDVSDRYALLGVAADAARLSKGFSAPLPSPAQGTACSGGWLLHWPAASGCARALWLGESTQASALWPSWQSTFPPAPAAWWRAGEIAAGIPWIVDATREQFVPQMVNFELVGGVNFRKGCYPGQEIVARSQYLGKLKRRMQVARADDGPVAPGMEVFSLDDPDQPCGLVVNAECDAGGQWTCLVEIKRDLEASALRVQRPDGPSLQLGSLPYPLTDPA